MSGQTIVLGSEASRDIACSLVLRVPSGFVFNISPPKRTQDQSSRMWAMLGDISRAKPEGRCLTPDVWKSLFLHALDHTQRFEMALDGNGMVPTGFRSSRLTKRQMSDLIETIAEYGARHGVQFND